MQGDKVMYSSDKQDWATPRDLFSRLDEEFHFVLDAAASPWNACCPRYFTAEDDALTRSWDYGGSVWCNPPYSRGIGKWVKKAYDEARTHHITVVLLIFARTDTAYFHDYIYGKAELRFLRGRVHFLDWGMTASENPAPAPSMIAVFRGEEMQDCGD